MPTSQDESIVQWVNNVVPNWLQWVGLFATLAGAALSLWAVFSARSARQQASLAREAAVRLGHVTQIGDILAEMRELQVMLIRQDLELVAMKCNHLRGRVVRFKGETYNQLSEAQAGQLDLARDQLEIMVQSASATSRASITTRIGRLIPAYGNAQEALSKAEAAIKTSAKE